MTSSSPWAGWVGAHKTGRPTSDVRETLVPKWPPFKLHFPRPLAAQIQAKIAVFPAAAGRADPGQNCRPQALRFECVCPCGCASLHDRLPLHLPASLPLRRSPVLPPHVFLQATAVCATLLRCGLATTCTSDTPPTPTNDRGIALVANWAVEGRARTTWHRHNPPAQPNPNYLILTGWSVRMHPNLRCKPPWRTPIPTTATSGGGTTEADPPAHPPPQLPPRRAGACLPVP